MAVNGPESAHLPFAKGVVVAVGLFVAVDVAVGLLVAVDVAVGVAVLVGTIGVAVGVCVLVAEGVGDLVGVAV